MERCLLVSLGLVTVIAVILIITTSVAMARPRELTRPGSRLPTQVCRAAVCQERARLVLESLDESVDPCDDFYGYVCNKWMRQNPVPDDRPRFSIFDSLRIKLMHQLKDILEKAPFKVENQNVTDKVAIAYRACTNESISEELKFDSLKEFLSSMGFSKWPMPVGWDSAPPWEETFARVFRKTGLSFIISASVVQDLKNATYFIISLDQPGFGIGRNQLLNQTSANNAPIVRAYKTYASDSIRLFQPQMGAGEREAVVDDIVNFESQLAKMTRSPEERRNMNSLYHRMTMARLMLDYPELDWLRLFNNIFDVINMTLTEDEEIVLREPQFYSSVLQFLKSVRRSTLYNYVGWRLVQGFGPLASGRMRDLEFEFGRVVQGVRKSLPVWQRCIAILSAVMDHPVGRLYIDNEFSPQAKEDMVSMVKDLKEAFSALLQQNNWMDYTTKKEAAKKLEGIIDNIAYPDWLKNNTYLNNRYDHVDKVVPEKPFLDMYMNFRQNNIFKRLKKLREFSNRSEEWHSGSAVVNAFYSPNANSITFPAGVLQSPFYDYGLPSSVNMGAIGMIIGHEITHGFDDTGSQFDSDGNLRNWWTEETRRKFSERAKCFIDQYGSILDPQAQMHLNGINTQGENIADSGGIREAFRAYRISLAKTGNPLGVALPGLERFTSDQMFFISTATAWCANTRTEELKNILQYDSHSPAKYRVILPMGNFEEFSRAFSCSANSRMNLSRKCVLW